MSRRFPVDRLAVGIVRLDAEQSRHARDVVRMQPGERADLFDLSGNHATGTVVGLRPEVTFEVAEIRQSQPRECRLVIASAIPKGNRADWMIEKLSELDVAVLAPLNCERSVVRPEEGKLQRFSRIAAESAKQCRRRDVLQILLPQTPASVCASAGIYPMRWCLSTTGVTTPITKVVGPAVGDVLAAIGPEGGWTDREAMDFAAAGFHSISLTNTILRIETAAAAVAAIVMSHANQKDPES